METLDDEAKEEKGLDPASSYVVTMYKTAAEIVDCAPVVFTFYDIKSFFFCVGHCSYLYDFLAM